MAWAPVLDQASVTEQGSRNMSASSTVSTSEAQLEQVLECARQAGFDSLDDFVSAYYATRFDESSTLFFQQRQSRNRHLPGILAEIRQSSRTWTKWERQGYMHEILQSAEAILLNEFRTFANSTDLLEQIRNFDLSKEDVSTNGEGISKSSEIYDILLETQKRCYTELPNLWATLTALTDSNSSMDRGDQKHIILACHLLLCIAGRIPKSKLVDCMNACIGGQGPSP